MAATSRAVELLRGLEGKRLSPYRDGAGWSVGYGHWSPGKPEPMTEEAAEETLIADADYAASVVDSAVVVTLSDDERDALTLLVFNIGHMHFMHSTLLHKLNTGDRAGAAAQFDVWRIANGEVSPTLVKRRAMERALFEGTKPKGTIMDSRVKEPSTWAGAGLMLQAIAQLIATKGMDGTAWATLAAGVAAIFMREKPAA
jgi:lysozyme